jgi:hypothetical protein
MKIIHGEIQVPSKYRKDVISILSDINKRSGTKENKQFYIKPTTVRKAQRTMGRSAVSGNFIPVFCRLALPVNEALSLVKNSLEWLIIIGYLRDAYSKKGFPFDLFISFIKKGRKYKFNIKTVFNNNNIKKIIKVLFY